ncbi:mitochondrial peripheral inner membrane protein [Yamadazyma tenuis]|uniref:FAD-binding FR-type domain-containing protein n=1 Tax=Candida tenuis (strain ATCC 10573 / BCRC 21748 / CBS 615 / JCM 9827 / NBRC 10315 / NRRL Y-1498 / VKM Y-70) TaxID=590646 RepID=G3AZ14_CANTC|nr:uncharacterized protein CANTEDRAFT_118987 [Yamadazyma tenuis ATCC 10573]EGV65979.1 hypothetical protein CANTEDRAFT_118987 [Yamadazyma tenuis ATCC 10573]WEJ95681.1 mitochondrial peripheral inner membrane protein [Yamadazyma tenuis]
MLLRSIGRVTKTPVSRHVGPPMWTRFKSSDIPKNNGNLNNDSKAVSKKETQEIGEFKVKSTSSSAAPAPLENSQVSKFMKKNTKPYIPKLKHERLTYEYPGLPNQDDFTKQSKEGKIKPIKRYTRYIPHMITAVVCVWVGYTIKVWVYPPDEGADSVELLDPESFHKFVITHKQQIDKDHYLIEIAPRFKHWQYSFYTDYSQKSIWGGDRIWSVEVKQPQIMVVRSYTPLPLYFMKSEYTRSGEREPLLKVITPNSNDYDHGGVMTLYVKKYDDGEVSKYITNKNVGDELELRGPHIEYKFPYHPLSKLHERPVFKDLPSKVEPEIYADKLKLVNNLPDYDNLTFFAAGTGIAPVLQVLMSKNPYRGFITVHYSARGPNEIEPLERFMFFLEKLDRVKFIRHYDSEQTFLTGKDILKPEPSNYLSPMRKEKIQKLNELTAEDALKLRKSILDNDNDTKVDEELEKKLEQFDKTIVHYGSAIEQAKVTSKQPKKSSSLAVVCGPDGYVDYVAGPLDKVANEQGEVKGLLGQKEWNNANTFKLSN